MKLCLILYLIFLCNIINVFSSVSTNIKLLIINANKNSIIPKKSITCTKKMSSEVEICISKYNIQMFFLSFFCELKSITTLLGIEAKFCYIHDFLVERKFKTPQNNANLYFVSSQR